MECKVSKDTGVSLDNLYWNISRMECKAIQNSSSIAERQHWNISRMECKALINHLRILSDHTIGIYPEWNVKCFADTLYHLPE